jgi:hypothetical protein
MISLLSKILCAIEGLAVHLADWLVAIVNLLVAAIGALAAAIVSLLPGFPAPPDHPSSTILGYVNWFLPLGGLLAGFAVFVGIWALWLLIAIPLRWVKAIA